MYIRQALRTMIATACVAAGLAGAIQAQASVVIAGTRVIYHAADAEETIKISNEGKSPALVQSWIDDGDAKAAPASIDVPFTITPPIARIDPARAQTLRVVYTGDALPQDRESVFWMNVLEIPPKPDADEADPNRLQLAFRSRIKLFFRPAGLKGSADDAAAQVTWRLTRSDGSLAIEARNPTAYHVSFTSVEVKAAGQTAIFDDGDMVGPGETRLFKLKGDVANAPDAKVHYRWLNDFGGAVDGDAPLQRGEAAPAR
jgi:P pilus assembly chaperone PapD